MAAGDRYFFWNNTPAHTTAIMQDCRAAMNIKTILHLENSPELMPVDCFLFPRVKAELVGISVTHEACQKAWAGVQRTIGEKGFAATGRKQVFLNRRWICRKILLNITFMKMNSFHCISSVRIALRHTSRTLALYPPFSFPLPLSCSLPFTLPVLGDCQI
jgi:hypothetical protein